MSAPSAGWARNSRTAVEECLSTELPPDAPPLLHPDLLEIMADGFALGFSEILINTNGTRVTPERAAKLAAFPKVDLIVSLDGPESLHDEIRGPGVYGKATEAIQLLAGAGVRTSVMGTVTRRLLPL